MEIEPSDNPNELEEPTEPQPPYEPIKFVYTETIGSIDEKFREIIDPYTWTYEDLLEPKIIYGKSKIEYYLFHIAPIYNWLRHVGSGMLAQYVGRGDDGKAKVGNNFNTNNNFNNNNNNNKNLSSYTPFSLETWKFEMKHYIAQWEIAKLCASAKIKILTTRVENQENNKYKYNNNKNNNNNIKQKQQQQEESQILCTHLIKKDKFTTDYVLNTLDTQNNNNKNNNSIPKLECRTIYCEECQQEIKVKSEIIKYPFAPYFNKYHGKEFTIITNELSETKTTYQLVIIYCLEKLYVKSSGGVWYEISFKENKKSIVSFERIDNKAGLVFVYQQKVMTKENKVLKKAEPVKVEEMKKEEKGLVDLAKFLTKEKNVNNGDYDDSEEEQVKVLNNNNKQKILEQPKSNVVTTTGNVVNKQQTAAISNKKESQNTNTNQPQTLQEQQQPQQEEQEKIEEENDEPLEDMTKNPLPIVLNKKKTERKLFKEYKKTVESLLPKPKEKDEYEREYDKGKTKKIHKNRQQFRTADFFQLYNKIKGNNNGGVQQQEQQNNNKKDDNNEDNDNNHDDMMMRDENKREKKTNNNNNNNGDDDDYNFVCQPKRSDRFRDSRGRGRGGRGGGRGGRFGDRDGSRDRGGRDGRGRDGGRGRGRGNGRGGRGGGNGRGGSGGFKSYGDKGRNNNGDRNHSHSNGNKSYHNKNNYKNNNHNNSSN